MPLMRHEGNTRAYAIPAEASYDSGRQPQEERQIHMAQKKTKIVCTMGPACEDEETLRKLIENGMNVARFNFSHGTHESQKAMMERVRKVADEMGVPVAIMLDTKGPEVRTGIIEGGGKVAIETGSDIVVVTDNVPCTPSRISLDYKNLPNEVEPGATILIDDGLIELNVMAVEDGEIRCRVMNGGELGEHKGVNIPGVEVGLPSVTDRDREDIIFGCELGIDAIAASFIRSATAVQEIRSILAAHGAENVKVFPKIESVLGVANFDEILEASDGIMVARGDLGVEVPPAQVPHLQKMIIAKCNDAYKIVITATQMLNSMIENPRPTRAEITDVANAIYDGTDCVMLSGETASGKYPAEAVKTMSDICVETELHLEKRKAYHERRGLANVSAATGFSAVFMAEQVGAAAILCPSHSGRTARIVSAYRPDLPILVPSPNEETLRNCCFIWGAKAYKTIEQGTLQNTIYHSLQVAPNVGLVDAGELVVITAGDPQTSPRMGDYSTSTNMAMVAQIQ